VTPFLILIGHGHRTIWKLLGDRTITIYAVTNRRKPTKDYHNDPNSILKKSGDRTTWFSGDDFVT